MPTFTIDLRIPGMQRALQRAMYEHAQRVEAHLTAELARLGVPLEEAPNRVVVLMRQPMCMLRPGEAWPMPEVLTHEQYTERFTEHQAPHGPNSYPHETDEDPGDAP